MYCYKIATDIKERRFIPLSGHRRLIADEISQGSDEC
jgi:hypothetical protein